MLATLSTAAPPALVWLPPAQWRPGDRVRVTTLPLHLPRTFAVRTAGSAEQPAAIFRRQPDGRLVQLPPTLATAPAVGAALAEAGLGPLAAAETEIRFADGSRAPLRVWVETRPGWPGAPVDVWVQWGMAPWPEGLSAFVQLRRDGATVAQADGAPGFWAETGAGLRNDWRQVTIPADTPAGASAGGDWTLALGLYDPQSGVRVPLATGDELVIPLPAPGAPPIPDQACALIPATCGAR